MSNAMFFILFLMMIISVWDIKFKKIPNVFILIGIVYIFSEAIIRDGIGTMPDVFLKLIVGFLALIILWGVIAAGDVKLLIVVSLVLGVIQTWKIFFISTIVLMVYYLIKNPKKTTKKLKLTLYRYIYQIGVSEKQKTVAIAYSPFIAIAFILNIFI